MSLQNSPKLRRSAKLASRSNPRMSQGTDGRGIVRSPARWLLASGGTSVRAIYGDISQLRRLPQAAGLVMPEKVPATMQLTQGL